MLVYGARAAFNCLEPESAPGPDFRSRNHPKKWWLCNTACHAVRFLFITLIFNNLEQYQFITHIAIVEKCDAKMRGSKLSGTKN